jgi:prepilin-type N-terminal cleavage/methylation domain-containing protein
MSRARRPIRRQAFSLLEVLAATVVLGLLAVAVVPLTRHLVGDDGHLLARVSANDLIQHLDLTALPQSGIATPVAQHAGWWVRTVRLTPVVPVASPDQPAIRITHQWIRVQLVDGPGPAARVVAERLIIQNSP